MVTMPMQHEGKEISAIRTTTLAQLGQQHLSNAGNGAKVTRAAMPL
jgi:hypothetical protein